MSIYNIVWVSVILALFSSASSLANEPQSPYYSACDDRGASPKLADSDCIYIQTPLDHEAPEDQTIDLFVRKFPATRTHRGEIWLLAGGPGESGASFYADIEFFRNVFADYDIIVPDHRGTGYSTKLCEPEETRDSSDGLSLSGEEWGTCFGALYAATDRAHHFNQRNAAHDVDDLIKKLGSNKKTLIYAVSYGTSLALEYANISTTNVDGIVLDSLTPSLSDALSGLSYRSHTTDRVGKALLDRCANDPDCVLGPDAKAKYRTLLEAIDNGEAILGMDSVPNNDLRQFFGLLLDVPETRNRIPAIIDALSMRKPEATELIQKATSDYEAFWNPILSFEQAVFSIPLSGLISGSEFNARRDLTIEELTREKAELDFASPLPGLLVNNQIPLYETPGEPLMREQLPPLLVLQGTFDPKTPYDAAMRRVATLKKHADVAVVSLLDAPHAAYFTGKDCLAEPLSRFAIEAASVESHECSPEAAAITFD
ncbi:MAG: alpha/beta fold hydrolase [Pseudomonadota bacterium]